MEFLKFSLIDKGCTGLARAPLRNPAVAAGIIAGAGSLLGGLFSSSGQSATNKMNYRIYQEQRAWQEHMISKQNEYNSPVAQVERYEDAGINPYMAMSAGNVGSGNQSSLPQAQTPVMQNAAAPVAQAFLQAGQQIQSAVNATFDNNLKFQQSLAAAASANETLLRNEFFKQTWDAQLQTLNLQLTGMSLDNARSQMQLNRDSLQYSIEQKYGLESAKWNLRNLQQDFMNKLAQEGLIKNQSDFTFAQIATEKEKVRLVAAQVVDTYASVNLKNAQALNEQDRHSLFLQTEDYLVSSAESQAQINGYNAEISSMESSKKRANYKYEVVSDYYEKQSRASLGRQNVFWEGPRGLFSTFGSLVSPIFKLAK